MVSFQLGTKAFCRRWRRGRYWVWRLSGWTAVDSEAPLLPHPITFSSWRRKGKPSVSVWFDLDIQLANTKARSANRALSVLITRCLTRTRGNDLLPVLGFHWGDTDRRSIHWCLIALLKVYNPWTMLIFFAYSYCDRSLRLFKVSVIYHEIDRI